MSFLGTGTKSHVKVGGMLSRKVQKDDPRVAFLLRCKQDINFYFKHINFTPTWQQKELVDAMVAGFPNIAVRSGKGPGKTACTGALVPWWNLTNALSQGIVTAPTMQQCKSLWLSQAQKWIMDGDPRIRYFFKFTGTGYGILNHKQDVWGLYLRTATTPEGFQGIHNERLLIYCEEASGISRPIMQAIQDTLTGQKTGLSDDQLRRLIEDRDRRTVPDELKKLRKAKNIWLAVGNPNSRSCRFFDFFHSLAANPWLPLHWNAEETPKSKWFSGERNIEIAEEFGVDSNVYRVAVLGEFPAEDASSLISEDDYDRCHTQANYDKAMQIVDNECQFGIDLARMGGDKNVVVARQGGIMLSKWAKEMVDPSVAIDQARKEQEMLRWKDKDCMYVIDAVGIGDGLVGTVGSSHKMNKKVHEFKSNHKAHDPKYADKATEAWFSFAKRVRRGEVYLGSKKDARLRFQATNRRYHFNTKNQLQIESKDEYKKRIANMGDSGMAVSPDDIDAVVMAFYEKATQSMRVVTA